MTVRQNTTVTWNPNPTTRGRVAQVTADAIAIQFFNPTTGSHGRETVTPAQFAAEWTVELSAAQKLEQAAEALADVVDAYRTVVRLSRTQPNSRNWRTAYSTYCDAAVRYSTLTGLNQMDINDKVHGIAECFTAA